MRTTKAIGKPTSTRKVSVGDIVQVVHLPPSMSHFRVGIGIVCEKDDDSGDFFINFTDKRLKLIKNGVSGWYSPNNVEVLVKSGDIEDRLRAALTTAGFNKLYNSLQSIV